MTPLRFAYDEHGRGQSVESGSGASLRRITMEYDQTSGHLAHLYGPLASTSAPSATPTWSLGTDVMGRVRSQTRADGAVTVFGRDELGSVTSLTPPGRPGHGFGYDWVNSPDRYTAPAAQSGGAPADTHVVNNYDRVPRRIVLPDAREVENFYIDAKLRTVRAPRGDYTLGYAEETGLLASIDTPDGQRLCNDLGDGSAHLLICLSA